MTTPSEPQNTTAPDFSAVPDAPRSKDPELVLRLAEALGKAGFRAEPIRELLGRDAVEALARDQAAPALRALRQLAQRHPEGSAQRRLGVVVELLLLARPVGQAQLAEALPEISPQELAHLGVVELEGDRARSLVDLDVHEGDDGLHLWIASDLSAFQRPGAALRHDHVLGVGGASQTLVQITDPRPAATALDLGTGCGIQSFHLLRRVERVVATDLSERALGFARFNLILNAQALGLDPYHLQRRIELRCGSLLEPVAGERFDLVVSNPPFVITPRTPQEDEAQRYTYRDGGREGDTLIAELLGGIEQVMAPGASAHLLGNWEIPAEAVELAGGRLERAWFERVESWLPPELEAWVIQREIESPQGYAETWLRDASEHLDRQRYEQAYEAYLEDFAARSVAGIGFGWVRLDRPPEGHEAAPRRRFEHLGHPAQQPVGAVLAETVRRESELDRLGPAWEELHLVVPDHVTEERHGHPGAEDPSVILVRQGAGLQRTAMLTSEAAGLMGACDGELSVGQIVGALGALLDWQAEPGHRPQEALALLEQARSLLVDGFLDVADPEEPDDSAQP
ncbi:methyltransferase [Kocuria sp. p3-SID1433]|uniref:DUF7059 domain-containing protein n=1 Tax=unclassified Kocuria TaxID=2649579 RepID=UPI0021A680DD|nr:MULTISPECIES: methyltransferase [unclassified Kocuria]MCT1602201.1 methyltransferase [Kocuria sp. p3-SID1428]MCT2179658.1 methyltransferase [Kocuria sp. p3-SID1433]